MSFWSKKAFEYLEELNNHGWTVTFHAWPSSRKFRVSMENVNGPKHSVYDYSYERAIARLLELSYAIKREEWGDRK